MFWGLIMEPNKRYTQTVEKSFHVSMASLDVSTADDDIVQVMFCYENRNYLLCSLKKGSAWQVPLDLNFHEGTKIAFTSNGRGHVHLTGYLIPDEDDLDLDELEEEEDEDEDVPQLVSKQSKRKALDSPKETKTSKRIKQEQQQEDEESLDDDDDDDDDDLDEDDSEDDIDEDDEEEEVENEEVDSEEDEEGDEEEVVEEEEDEIIENIVKSKKKNKQSQQQQQQQRQQQQQQQNKKQDKQKMVNGKELKQEQVKQKKNKGEQQPLNNSKNEQKIRTIEGGVQIEDIKVGSGAPVKSGKFVSVYYIGRLKNGKKFDATTHGDGFKFRLGKGEVIKGWDIGIAGMKTGGKRRITIPPALAYGAKGSPPVIPGNSTLVFEVELRNVH